MGRMMRMAPDAGKDAAITGWTAPVVVQMDGATAVPEAMMLREYLAWSRTAFLSKCAGLTGEQLARRANPPSTLSLLGLIRHLAKVERIWFRERFPGVAMEPMYPGPKDADFDDTDAAQAKADYERLLREQRLAEDAVRDTSLDAAFDLAGEPISLRLVHLHMIQEYSRHCGHADFLREQIDGVTGY
jgi:uncharacterized damage-inducible protein DinB